MSSVHILLDNYVNVCYPGQTISGKVECNFDKVKRLRAVRIKFKGRAETQWTESERYYDSTHKEHKTRHVRYYGEEEYFNAEYILIQGGDDFTLPAGRHTYPFSYILPAHLPSSFEAHYGNIRYSIKATVDRPWKFDYEQIIAFNVVSPLDLNYIPDVRNPVATSVDKTMCSCWCNDSGAMTFEMSLPASGFVPGQDVSVGARIENMTNVSAQSVAFKMIGVVEFIAHYPSSRTRYEDKIISECSEAGVGAHGEKSWTSTLTIPANDHYPNLIPCSIINVNYHLKGKVVLPCPHSDLRNEVPLMIGSVPLSGMISTFSAGPPPQMPFAAPTSEVVPLLQRPDHDEITNGFVDIQAPSQPVAQPYPQKDGLPHPSVAGTIPYPPPGNSPYPPAAAPYPPAGGALCPPAGGLPYPPAGPSYPPAGGSPYPPAGGAPYPPTGGSPYPSAGGSPYPPAGGSPYPPTGGSPYPPAGGSPYPPAGGSPYLPSSGGDIVKSPSAPPDGTSYGGSANPSAPLAPGTASYPPAAAGAAPYPPAGAPYPTSNSEMAPPSYEEIQKTKEKSEKY